MVCLITITLSRGERRQCDSGRNGQDAGRHTSYRMAVGQGAEGGDLEPRVQTDEYGAVSSRIRWIANVGWSIGGRG
jgi:hypothetical protein